MTQGKSNDGFFGTDFTKGLTSMPFDLQSFMDLQRKNLQAFGEAQQLAMENIQAVAQKQGEFISQMVEENSKLAKDMMAEGSTEEKVARQADMVKHAYETSMINAQKIAEMVGASNQQTSEIINKRISCSLGEMKASMEKAQKQTTKAA
ncbi:MAG: phasin family protein [Pseudomonadota bacterium]